jgi:hypothetical protein
LLLCTAERLFASVDRVHWHLSDGTLKSAMQNHLKF